MAFIKTFFLAFLLVLFSGRLIAQNKIVEKTDSLGAYKISDVVITATKTEENSLRLANSITVIDSAEIADRNVQNLIDLLRTEPGISTTSQGGAGTLTNVYLRGGKPDYTLVLVDGVELNLNNDPNGVFDFASFPLENIERVEILRGPQSTIYGADAMSGVINIITKKGSGAPGFSLSALGGSYNTFKLNASSLGEIDNFNYSLSLGRHKSDGFSSANEKYNNTEKDGFHKDQIISTIGYDFSENIKNDVFVRFSKSESDLDQSGIYGDDPTYKFEQEEINLNNVTRISLLSDVWNQKIGLSFVRNVRKYQFDETINNPASSRSMYDGRKYKFEWQNNFSMIDNNLISFGIDFQYDEAFSEYLYFSSFNYESVFPKNNSKIFGAYLLDQIKIGQSFFASIGARVDNHNKFGSAITYQFAPAYIIWETGTKLKATVGSGYKAPSLFNLFDPAFGNADLKPEKSLGIDAGIEQFFWNDGISFGATYFFNRFDDMFGFDPSTFKTININKAQTSGVEVFFTLKPLSQFNLKANYTYTIAEDITDGISNEEKQLLRIPEHKVGLFLSCNFMDAANTNVELIYTGKREDKDFSTFPATRLELKEYFLVNLSANYELNKYLQLNFRIENLLDSDFMEVFGYGTAGISIYTGINFNF